MNDVIQCPTCSKKFRLPAKPPPTFTCNGCGTVMDLSAFQAAAAPAVPAAPAAPAAAGAPALVRHSHRTMHRKPHGRHAEEEAAEEEREGRHHYQRKKDNTAMLVGISLGAMVVLGALAFVVMRGEGGDEPKDKARGPGTTAGAPGAGTPVAGPETPPATAPGPTAPGTTPAPEAPKTPNAPGTTGGSYSASRAEVKVYPFLEDTTAEEQTKINEAIQAAVEVGGRDGRDGEAYLIGMGLKAAPRLISEFKAIVDKYGLEQPEGLKRAMVLDRVLRRIDGVQERKFKDKQTIHYSSDPKEALNTVKRWNWWWDTGAWKTPMKPWDPREDEADTEEGGEGQ